MRCARILFASLLTLTLSAQQEDAPGQIFRATVNVVVAPVTVTDRDGNYVNDLKPSDFRLFDNEKPQDIKVDVSYIPISLVVAVCSSAAVAIWLICMATLLTCSRMSRSATRAISSFGTSMPT